MTIEITNIGIKDNMKNNPCIVFYFNCSQLTYQHSFHKQT